MELREVASVSGRGGLFKILKPTKSGVILEAIDASKKRFVAGASERVSILNEISIYTTDKEGSVALEVILQKVKEKYGKDLKVSTKSSNEELGAFLESVLPDYDREKVYHSDIKKLVGWYTILIANYPEVMDKKEAAAAPKAKAAEAPVEAGAEEPVKKEAKKKAVKAEKPAEEAKAKPAAKKTAKSKTSE